MRCVCFLPVLQGNGDWTVNYSSSNVCTIRGGMVDVLILSLSPLLPSSTPYSLPPHLSNFKAYSRIAPTEAHRLKGRGL